MSLRRTSATAKRVLNQLKHDRRTLALILLIPCVLISLLKYVFEDQPQVFNSVAPMMLGIFPLFMMFLVTSIATLRERTTGTLDCLMTQPISKFDLIFGYALAFSFVGFLQAILASFVTLGLLDVRVMGGTLPILIVAVSAAFLGTSLGLLVSAFARSEFQAVQLVMPILMPQVLLCGLFIARDKMADWLQNISDFFPLTYSVHAMQEVAMNVEWTSELSRDLIVVFGSGILALVLGSITIKRQE